MDFDLMINVNLIYNTFCDFKNAINHIKKIIEEQNTYIKHLKDIQISSDGQ